MSWRQVMFSALNSDSSRASFFLKECFLRVFLDVFGDFIELMDFLLYMKAVAIATM